MASTNDIITSDSGSGSIHDELANPSSDSSRKSKNSQSANINGNSVAVDDVPSDIEMAAMGKPEEGKTRWQRAKAKRWFTKGVPAIPCAIFTFCLTTLCLCAIAIPTLLLGMGPPLAQDAVSATYIEIYNNRITSWSYESNPNNTDCQEFFPTTLTVVQDLYFTGIPWYATMGTLYIRPANLTLSYNGTNFGQLFVPQIDLNHVDGGNKWANDTVTTMVITNITAFLAGNKDLIPLEGLSQGWAMWHQSGNVILQETVIGVQMYYAADMSQDINITEVSFLAGPMQPDILSNNIMTTLACTADYL